MSEPTLYRKATQADREAAYLGQKPLPVRKWVVPVEPDHTVLMCEYCLCYTDKSQADEACWNCGAYRVQGFALFMLGDGMVATMSEPTIYQIGKLESPQQERRLVELGVLVPVEEAELQSIYVKGWNDTIAKALTVLVDMGLSFDQTRKFESRLRPGVGIGGDE